jgi:diguanylate cyclase (GGDEF)-like protein
VADKVLVVEASVGVSQLRPDETLDQAIQRADGGLYQAKRSGRNQVGVFAEVAPSI